LRNHVQVFRKQPVKVLKRWRTFVNQVLTVVCEYAKPCPIRSASKDVLTCCRE
jgi:hypothetical protein